MPSSVPFLSVLCLIIEGRQALLSPSPRRPAMSLLHRQIYSDGRMGQIYNDSSLLASPSSMEERSRRRARIKSSGGGAATLSKARRRSKPSTATTAAKKSAKKSELVDGKEAKDEEEEGEERPVEYQIRKPTRHTKSGAPFQHQEMMDHDILTKDEEMVYGRQVVRAHELREQIESLLAERRAEVELRRLEMEEMAIDDNKAEKVGEDGEGGLDSDFLTYELEYLSVYGFRPSEQKVDEFDLEDDLLIDHAQHRSQHMSQLTSHDDIFTGNDVGPKRNGYRNGSSSAGNANNRNSYTPLFHVPIHELSESDVVDVLDIPGGKQELVDILLDGSYAREILMRRNVKLVMSIAKNWMRNSFSTANSNLSGGANDGGGGLDKKNGKKTANKSTNKYLSQLYEGSWDRPSLDEAVQEGMLGLARAVDKYDPERGLRFSTYATHWITSYVRVCFQRAVTGCLRVPSQLHDIKAAYKRIVRDHMQVNAEPPNQKNIAHELGVSEKRLATAIRATGSLLSVDAPVMSASGSGSYKGSMAGGDGANGQELLILDTLKCAEPRPEDQVEISFLRQCLENAMASELTPYERDVVRLRLGLDSGAGCTVREIVELSGGSVTTSDVRSAERRAFRKLRSPGSVHAHNLLAYLDMAGVDVDGTLRR